MTTEGRRMRRACFANAAAGAFALGAVLLTGHARFSSGWLFPFFAAVLLFAYARPVRFWHDGQAENMSLDEALFVPMVLLLTPAEIMVAIGLSGTLGVL